MNEEIDAVKACQPAADFFGLSVIETIDLLRKAAAKAARETTARAMVPLRPETEEAPSSSSSPKVRAVFGSIPPDFQTKRHSKTVIPDDMLHDPEVVQAARNIVNANRRTKIETLDPTARETLRIARRIVRANEPKLAEKAATRKTTDHMTDAPLLGDVAIVRALAGLEHLQNQFSASSDKPEAERARIARQFVSAFERAKRRGDDVDVEMVREARRFLTGYNRRQRTLKQAALSAT